MGRHGLLLLFLLCLVFSEITLGKKHSNGNQKKKRVQVSPALLFPPAHLNTTTTQAPTTTNTPSGTPTTTNTPSGTTTTPSATLSSVTPTPSSNQTLTTAAPTTPAPSTLPGPPVLDNGGFKDEDLPIPFELPTPENTDERGEIYEHQHHPNKSLSYIIVLKCMEMEDEDKVAQDISNLLVKKSEGTDAVIDLIVKWGDEEEIYCGELFVKFASISSRSAVKKLLQQIVVLDSVDFIERNPTFLPFQTIPWHLDRIDQESSNLDNKFQVSQTGEGVNVYVLDSGVNVDHSEFEGRAQLGFTAFDSPKDENGHGTHVAGIIGGKTYGVAKKVTIISVRVLDQEGAGDYTQISEGINWILNNYKKPAVVNLSLGIKDDAPLLKALLQKLVDSGIVVVSAAGNDNENACDWFPAGGLNTISVGATTMNDERADFSNWGSCLDVFAPGSNIISAGPSSTSEIVSKSGTSMASPIIAGLAALYLQKYPSATHQQFKQALTISSTKGLVVDAGVGSPNRIAITKLLDIPPGTASPPCEGLSPCFVSEGTTLNRVTIPSDGIKVTSQTNFLRGWLQAKNFRFRLLKLNKSTSQWEVVTRSETPGGKNEVINYAVTPGTYAWELQSTSKLTTPASYELQYAQILTVNSQSTSESSYLRSSVLLTLLVFVFSLFF